MAPALRDAHRLVSAWALSIAVHSGLLGVGALIMARTLASHQAAAEPTPAVSNPPSTAPVEIELPVVLDGTLAVESEAAEPLGMLARGGGEGTARPDTGARGRGGTDGVELPALNLADRDDGAFLSAEVRSHLTRSQIQRIRSATHRASREDWRASREPMELTFVASGRGRRPERRPSTATDPSVGARDRGAAERIGSTLGGARQAIGVTVDREPVDAVAEALSSGATPRAVGGPAEGGDHASPGVGVRDGQRGTDHRDSAAVALGRPLVVEGAPAVPANIAGRPNDTVDSEQEVATAMQSIVHASTAGGARGLGVGGQVGPGASGSGGVAGPGSQAAALGSGRGGVLDNDPLDPRRSLYMRRVRAKLDPLWAHAFPKWAIAEGLQGTVIVTFTLRANGSVAEALVTRPSGIAEFDENCRSAVLRGAPYPPMPAELGSSFRWAMPFDARNPAVLPGRPASGP